MGRVNNKLNNPKILIAGASGYIGKALIPKLIEKYPNSEIIALSRSKQSSSFKQVTWIECDLFSLKSIEQAIPEDVDLAYYLIHSMGPTAHLDQGSFADYDLILADNFARALINTSLKQIIYLGGLVPNYEELSLHLESRLEVESVFKSFKLPVTIFRAGLILGEAGSSFQILLKLIKRLPVMICPSWTQTPTTPVDLSTVINSLADSALKLDYIYKTFDLAGCRPLSYLEMMQETARKLGKKRVFIKFPYFTPALSRLWVRLVTGSSKNLVYPLVESLKHPMIARCTHVYPKSANADNSYYDLLGRVNLVTKKSKQRFSFRIKSNTVRSVQRFRLPSGKGAAWVIEKYISWLPRFLTPFIKVTTNDKIIEFSLFLKKWVFLRLRRSPQRSDPTRQLLYITGGLLVGKENMGRLEFREVLDKRFIIAAIHEYKPSLPWYIYVISQAKLHLWVMNSFSKYLIRFEKIDKRLRREYPILT